MDIAIGLSHFKGKEITLNLSQQFYTILLPKSEGTGVTCFKQQLQVYGGNSMVLVKLQSTALFGRTPGFSHALAQHQWHHETNQVSKQRVFTNTVMIHTPSTQGNR